MIRRADGRLTYVGGNPNPQHTTIPLHSPRMACVRTYMRALRSLTLLARTEVKIMFRKGAQKLGRV